MKAIPKAVVVQLIKTHGILCQNCNKLDFEHIHHIDNDHSNNDFSNLMLLCVTCHHVKHRSDISDFNWKVIKIDLEDYIWLTKQGDYSHTMSMIIKKLRRELEEYRAKAKK